MELNLFLFSTIPSIQKQIELWLLSPDPERVYWYDRKRQKKLNDSVAGQSEVAKVEINQFQETTQGTQLFTSLKA